MKVISSSELSSEANIIKKYNDNILNDINDISELVEGLLGYWSGDDAVSYASKINDEIIPSLNKAYDKIDDYVLFMKKVNSVFKAVDENYDKNISV